MVRTGYIATHLTILNKTCEVLRKEEDIKQKQEKT